MARRRSSAISSAAAGRITRRRLPVLLGALTARPGNAPDSSVPGSGAGAIEIEPIAEIGPVALPVAPLEVHIARIVIPIGVTLPAATPGGVRLLAVTAGALTVELAAAAPASPLARAAPVGQRLVVPAGRAIALDARAVVGVANVGTRPVVALDAAVFPEAARPPARAFTTDDGVGFQVLAGGAAGLPPPEPCVVALARSEIPSEATLELAGLSLVYAESGTGWASATSGDVRAARAAGQAPGSTAGPWRAVAGNRRAPLTAGTALLLSSESAARIGNAGQSPVRLLMVTVRPDGTGTGPTSARTTTAWRTRDPG